MSINNPLGLEDLIINTIAGSTVVFSFLIVILISVMAAKFQMSKTSFLVILALFTVMFSVYLQGMFILAVVLAGYFVFVGLGKVFN